GKGPGGGVPHGVVLGQIFERAGSQPRFEGRAGRKPFDTVAVIGTAAGEVVAGQTRDADMTKLRMGEAARWHTVDDQADADPGTHGDIGKVVEAAPRAPAHLGECGPIDVGVERDRYAGC